MDDRAFHPLETWDADALMKLFREGLLARLIERHAISEELARKLLAWRHPGFSAHVGAAIPSEDKKAIEDVACYIVRNPLSLKKVVYPRRPEGRAVSLPHESLARTELRGHGPAGVAGASGRPYPRPG
jgi:hypothetical protein